LAADSADPVEDYKTVKQELKLYNPELVKKDEYIILTKTDEVTPEDLKKKISALKKLKKEIVPISIYDDNSLEAVKVILNKIQDSKIASKTKEEEAKREK
jgi:GTP-binding protein